jgi:ankyrin repeat protein
VKQLLAHKANARAIFDHNTTLVHVAAAAGQPWVLHQLLSLGLDVNALDAEGRSPVQVACEESGDPRCVDVLLSFGADKATPGVERYLEQWGDQVLRACPAPRAAALRLTRRGRSGARRRGGCAFRRGVHRRRAGGAQGARRGRQRLRGGSEG